MDMRGQFDDVSKWADVMPSKLAIIEANGAARTYAQLIDNARRVAARLRRFGVTQDDAVAIWGFNSCEWVEAMLGVVALGARPVPLGPEWTDEEAEHALERTNARALIHEVALGARSESLRDRMPGAIELLAMYWSEDADGPIGSDDLPAVPRDSGGVITFTSGTTGSAAKGVLQSPHGSRRRQLDVEQLWGITASDRTVVVTPFFHGNGLGGLVSALLGGGSLVFQRRFSARGFWPLVDLYRPTFLFTLAPIVNILMAAAPSPVESGSSLRAVLSLGSAADRDRIEERWRVQVFDYYAGSEMGGIASSALDDRAPAGAIGRVIAGINLRVLREDGTDCDVDEVGEFAVPLDDIGFAGYLGDEDATRAVVRNGLFHTGDLGRVDGNGYLYFADRKKDIVRRGGENISGLEIEAALRQHPNVADVAIVPVPDPILGERVGALVVPVVPGGGPTLADLREFGSSRLAHYKLPEAVRLVSDLPRTANGKVRKSEARAIFQAPPPVDGPERALPRTGRR
jgi:acyl-CoA synthetase (AMP-forming)/AMP-acid ligase II